jgi:hypothetical protein
VLLLVFVWSSKVSLCVRNKKKVGVTASESSN